MDSIDSSKNATCITLNVKRNEKECMNIYRSEIAEQLRSCVLAKYATKSQKYQ